MAAYRPRKYLWHYRATNVAALLLLATQTQDQMKPRALAFAQRFLLSTAGPAGIAVASFTVSLLLLAHISAADFGVYAFIQVLVIAGFSLSSAVFGLPLIVLLNREEREAESIVESFTLANALCCFIAPALLFLVLLALGGAAGISAAFATSAFLLWLRWFGRSLAYAVHRPGLAAASDLGYGSTLLCGALVLWWREELCLANIALVQIAGGSSGLLFLGYETLRAQVRGLLAGTLLPFKQGFLRHGRHALLAAVATEANVNAHSYIVTLMLGPAAFAPLAAAALFFRPVTLVIQSLNQVERPVLARMLKDRDRLLAWRTVSTIRLTALCAWVVTVGISYVFVRWFLPGLVHEGQDPTAIAQSACLWSVIFAVQCLRGPESTLVQANGDFRSLSRVTLLSSLITVPVVAFLAHSIGAIWSLGGVLLGEVVATALILRLARRSVPTTS